MEATQGHTNNTWKLTSGAVLAYEGLAAISKVAKRRFGTPEIPFITEIVRDLPRPARVIVTTVIAAAVHDHFDTRKIFG